MLRPDQRLALLEQMLVVFDEDNLTMFLDHRLDINFDHYAAPGDLRMRCFRLINRLTTEHKLLLLLQAFEAYHPNAMFRTFVVQLLATLPAVHAQAVSPGPAPRPHMVKNRPILNRHSFWAHLNAFAAAVGNRVLVVNGGVGKSYSRWLASHLCDGRNGGPVMVHVSMNVDNVLNVDGPRIAGLMAERLWGKQVAADDFTSSAREARDLGGRLVQKLSLTTTPTWIFLDELNHVNVDESALELIRKLCEAVDANECPNVWLFLVGLDHAKLDPRVGAFLLTDDVQRPKRNDIQDYLTWFAGAMSRPLTPVALDQAAGELDALLPTTPSHADWDAFRLALEDKCKAIVQGDLT